MGQGKTSELLNHLSQWRTETDQLFTRTSPLRDAIQEYRPELAEHFESKTKALNQKKDDCAALLDQIRNYSKGFDVAKDVKESMREAKALLVKTDKLIPPGNSEAASLAGDREAKIKESLEELGWLVQKIRRLQPAPDTGIRDRREDLQPLSDKLERKFRLAAALKKLEETRKLEETKD